MNQRHCSSISASATSTGGGAPQHEAPPKRRFWPLAAGLAGILVLLQLWQLPRIAGWTFFSFFDPGTALKGDLLISMGMKPAIDFGYTHGLASLVVAHWGFVLLGRTPAAFLIMTGAMEILMAAAIARFASAMRLSRAALVFLFFALPVAIMPCYLTLTHPLEALLLLWAIAEQASGQRERALALCTACLFVKPSMGYVYGLLLVIWTLRDWVGHERSATGLWRRTAPAIGTGLLMASAMIWRFGLKSLLLTIVPITGMRTYHDTHFGFFSGSGLRFWSPAYHPWYYYIITPAGIWLMMSIILLWVLLVQGLQRGENSACTTAAEALQQHTSNHRQSRRLFVPGGLAGQWVRSPDYFFETALSIALMHIAFVLGFYGWKYAWEYYSYLPVLFTALVISRCGKQQVRVAVILSVLAVCSQAKNVGLTLWCWHGKVRTYQTGYLWAYPQQLAQWRYVTHKVAGQRTLILSNGFVPWMPKGMSMPLSWFPEPGIPTVMEMHRLKREALAAHYIVVRRGYGKYGLWVNPAFAAVRRHFSMIWQGAYFSVWRRLHAPHRQKSLNAPLHAS
jgi:hypothetical protein